MQDQQYKEVENVVNRAFNFYAGPATLPLPVLRRAQAELLDYRGTGVSILEISHRAKEFDDIMNDACALVHEIFGVPDDYKVLWLQGGASSQFYMVPANIMHMGKGADFVNTGTWSKKAIKEAKLYGEVNIVASSEDRNFCYIPKDLKFNSDASYVHLASNNTIFGTQWQTYPDTGEVPLVCDMSSDIMCRAVDVKKFGIIFAGAQKNMGPAGTTLVIVREDLIDRAPENTPTMMRYKTHADKNSMFNTPPCFSIYICKMVLEWLKENGGVSWIEQRNRKKAEKLYNVIDNSNGFYSGHADTDSRSLMNVTYRLPTEELEAQCVKEGLARGLVGLKGHRSVGGMRASIYNAMPTEGVDKLCEFLKEFQENNQ
jgi:phosphoserine aminotransferase